MGGIPQHPGNVGMDDAGGNRDSQRVFRNIPRPKEHRSSVNGSEKVGGYGPLDGIEVGYQGQGMVLRHLPKSP